MVLAFSIETSCDETSVAIVNEKSEILSQITSNQSEHVKFGGVVPEIAARAHVENIDFIIQKALDKSNKKIHEIDGVAATVGPGLVVCLNIGFNIGKSLAIFEKKYRRNAVKELNKLQGILNKLD